MCGVAAVFMYRGGVVDPSELLRIRDRSACRGPDAAGQWLAPDGRVGLAHRRLAIIDLSERAAQPMQDADGPCVISFNGEIYNYQELKRGLEARGHRFHTESDTEVLLKLYAEQGDAMLSSLRGMFAFALWDPRRRELLIARDQFGIKPLYYAAGRTGVRVASEVKALLCANDVSRSPSAAGHVGFFLWGHVPEPFTLYDGIRALPAGTFARIDENGVGPLTQFANLRRLAQDVAAEGWAIRPGDASAEIRDAIHDSIRHHLIADVEVGVFLSAGIDSSVIAAVAASEAGASKLRTVTLGFDEFRGTPQDETILAAKTAEHLGTEHATVWVSRRDFEQARDELIDRMDQPTTDGVNSFFVARAVRQAGLKVALSGLGGDELFAGYPSFRELPRVTRLVRSIPGSSRLGPSFRRLVAPALRSRTSPKYASLLEYGGTLAGSYLLRRGLFLPWELPQILPSDLVEEGLSELATDERLEQSTAEISSPRVAISVLEGSWYMRNQLLRDADWASMSSSVEVRVPFVDWKLWRRMLALECARPTSVTKAALALSPLRSLPSEIFSRPKSGFGIPTRDWIRSENANRYGDRGLRGWARYIYDRFG